MVPEGHLTSLLGLLLVLFLGHGLLLVFLFLLDLIRALRRGVHVLLDVADLLLNLVHAFLETFHSLSQTFHELRNLLSAEKKKDDQGDNNNLPGAYDTLRKKC